MYSTGWGRYPAIETMLQVSATRTLATQPSPMTARGMGRGYIVLGHGGRRYLTKDACMSMTTFRRGYPAWEIFQAKRERYGACACFASLQAQRLGL